MQAPPPAAPGTDLCPVTGIAFGVVSPHDGKNTCSVCRRFAAASTRRGAAPAALGGWERLRPVRKQYFRAHPDVGRLVATADDLHNKKKEWAAAAAAWRDVARACDGAGAPGAAAVRAASLDNRAGALRHAGDYDAAVPAYAEAVAAAEAAYGAADPDAAVARARHAWARARAGGADLWLGVLVGELRAECALLRGACGPGDARTRWALSALSRALRRCGDDAGAARVAAELRGGGGGDGMADYQIHVQRGGDAGGAGGALAMEGDFAAPQPAPVPQPAAPQPQQPPPEPQGWI